MTTRLSIFNSNEMRRLIIKTFLLIIIPIAIVTVFMIMQSDDRSKNSHEINVKLAYERLDSLRNKNKIVIIAGSNGGFSIDSQILVDSLKMPVINTSTHAGIGVRMQFELYKELLQKGDIVVFCPEYYSDIKRLYGESTLIRILSTHMPKAYFKMSFGQWVHAFKYIGIHYQATRNHRGAQPTTGPYSSSSVNSFGDISHYREHKDIDKIYHFKGSMDETTTSYYQYIHTFSKSKGIELIYLPPTLTESTYKDQKSQIDSLVSFMRDNSIPFQAKPERYVFKDSLFYDTPYHMTTVGTTLRSIKLAEDIMRIVTK